MDRTTSSIGIHKFRLGRHLIAWEYPWSLYCFFKGTYN